MGAFQTRLVIASQSTSGGRSFQLLTHHDSPRLESFFLAMTFDQRRCCFGGGLSDDAITRFCRTIDWERVLIIGRTGPYCPEAVAMISALSTDATTAELSIICPLDCDRSAIIRTLRDLAVCAAVARYRKLVVHRELSPPDIVRTLLEISTASETSSDIIIKLR